MFSNLRHHAVSQAAHRALPAVSASDLVSWDKRRRGDLDQPLPAALYYGSNFHTALLEPHLWDVENLPDSGEQDWQRTQALAAANRLRERDDVAALLQIGYAEQTYTATHDATGVRVKVRPDLLTLTSELQMGRVYDAKTTSCESLEAFMKSITRYRYLIAAAMYADVTGAEGFTWIAAGKKDPYPVWFVKMTRTQWLSGRAEYNELLTAYAESQ